MKRILHIFILIVLSTSARADCIDNAAAYHRVNAQLVRAVAQQESGMRAHVVRMNTNGTEDIGLMQINSGWLPALAKFGIGREQLFDACVNAYVGTWILAAGIHRFGATWKAVGAYNAASRDKQLAYAYAIYERMRMQYIALFARDTRLRNIVPATHLRPVVSRLDQRMPIQSINKDVHIRMVNN